MKKKLGILLGLCMLTMAGCNGGQSVESQNADSILGTQGNETEKENEKENEKETVQSSEGESVATQHSEGMKDGIIYPLPPAVIEASASMPDGEYYALFGSDDLQNMDNGFGLTMEFFDYDVYNKEDILQMKEGDVINITVSKYDGEKAFTEREDVTVETISFETDADDQPAFAIINGGIEEYGIELTLNKELGVFENRLWENCPVFYSLGSATIPVSKNMTFQDCIDYETLPDGVVTYYDDLPDSIKEAEEKGVFTSNSTLVEIKNGEVVKLRRIWTP